MQIKEQWKGSRNWKLVTGVATAATLSIGAIAVASPSTDDVPRAIDLNDRITVTDDLARTGGSFVPFDISLDSPDASPSFDSLSLSADATDDSVQAFDQVEASGSFDSPETFDSFDSPDSSDSFDSPDDSD